jgi:hypothetical protein
LIDDDQWIIVGVGRITSIGEANDAWRRIKPFRGVDAARIRYLSDQEACRLVAACSKEFGVLVIAAL